MPRLFAALEVPREIRERLGLLRAGLRGARWVDPENYHITLRFAGDIDARAGAEFAGALSAIEAEAFEVRLDGLGAFGDRRPRAVWAGVAPCEKLLALQRATDRAARAAGLAPEARNYKPHVTLARLGGGSAAEVARYLERQGGPIVARFPATRFVLLSARAGSGGGPYAVEEAWPLKRGGAD